MKIVIVDYGMGNIKSIVSTLNYLGVEDVIVSSDYATLNTADKIILPGVGSFGKAIAKIREKNIDSHLKDLVLAKKKPLLGICLGMQLLGMSSSEDGENEGLGFVEGNVIKFDIPGLKVPHVGFNQVEVDPALKLYHGLKNNVDFYFTHSYRMQTTHHINQCMCDYGGKFVASFEKDNVAGVQFHPELSQQNGLTLMKNFIERF
jgi:glutamine amidotransferase